MEDAIRLTVKAPGKNRRRLRVEQRRDGYYYISRVPSGMKEPSVGDRVLEINGIRFERFKNATRANKLIDTFQIEIIPIDDWEDDATTDDDDSIFLESDGGSSSSYMSNEKDQDSDHLRKVLVRAKPRAQEPRKVVTASETSTTDSLRVRGEGATTAHNIRRVSQSRGTGHPSPRHENRVSIRHEERERRSSRVQSALFHETMAYSNENDSCASSSDDAIRLMKVGKSTSKQNGEKLRYTKPDGHPSRSEDECTIEAMHGVGRQVQKKAQDSTRGASYLPCSGKPLPKNENLQWIPPSDAAKREGHRKQEAAASESKGESFSPRSSRQSMRVMGPDEFDHSNNDDDERRTRIPVLNNENGSTFSEDNAVRHRTIEPSVSERDTRTTEDLIGEEWNTDSDDNGESASLDESSMSREKAGTDVLTDDVQIAIHRAGGESSNSSPVVRKGQSLSDLPATLATGSPPLAVNNERPLTEKGQNGPESVPDDQIQESPGSPRNAKTFISDEVSVTKGQRCHIGQAGEFEEQEHPISPQSPRKPLSASSLRHAMAKSRDAERSQFRPSSKSFLRPYVSKYSPQDKWMITVKKGPSEPIGILLVEHRRELFITNVDEGPFYHTGLDKGDKVLSINGKKIPGNISRVDEAETLMEGASTVTMFVMRPDNEKDLGYKWVMENF